MADELTLPDKHFETDIWEDINKLVTDKRRQVTDQESQITNREIVRDFVNLISTYTDEELEEMGQDEVINFGGSFREAQVFIARKEAILLGTQTPIKIVQDTGEPERDFKDSKELAQVFNRGVNMSPRFSNWWRSVCGEGYIAGAVPSLTGHNDKAGMYPELSHDLIFPVGTPLDPSQITYFYEPLSMSLADLKSLLEYETDEDDDDGYYVDTKAVEDIIETVIEQINEGTKNQSDENPLSNFSVRDNDDVLSCEEENITFEGYRYWEVRLRDVDRDDDDNITPESQKELREHGSRYVSTMIIIDGCSYSGKRSKLSSQPGVIQSEKYSFKNAARMMNFLIFDEEIGGGKTTDTARGLAEVNYAPAALLEEMRNLEVRGYMMTAIPTMKPGPNTNRDELLAYDPLRDYYAPEDVTYMDYGTSSAARHGRAISGDLANIVSGNTGSDVANTGRGQELRQQAVERQGNTTTIEGNNISKTYRKLDGVIDNLVYRVLTIEPDPYDIDYAVICWIRTELEERGFDLEFLAEQTYGNFSNIKVTADRTATGVDRGAEIEQATFLLNNINNAPPQLRQRVFNVATALATNNPDIVDLISVDPEPLASTQRMLAEMEWSTILRRSASDTVHPTNPTDVDVDHVSSHVIDLGAMVDSFEIEPWSRLDVTGFVGAVKHISLHLGNMKAKNEPELEFLQSTFQQIVSEGASLIQQVNEEFEQQQQGEDEIDPLTVARIQKIYAEIEKMGHDMALGMQKEQSVVESRRERRTDADQKIALSSRSQRVKETIDLTKLNQDLQGPPPQNTQ